MEKLENVENLASTSEYDALLSEGVALRAAGDTLAALTRYRQAANMPEANFVAFFNLGNVLFDRGEVKEAREFFEKAKTSNPNSLESVMQLARCDRQLGDYEAARKGYLQILAADKTNFSAWLELGHAFRAQGETQQMLAAYQHAANAAPHRWEGLVVLTRSFEENGQLDAAAMTYHRAVMAAGMSSEDGSTAKSTPVSNIHWQVAKFRHERGDAPRALEAMRQAIMANRIEAKQTEQDVNRSAEMQIDLADMLMRLGLTAEAHRAFERASIATSEATLVRLAERSFQYNLWQEAQEVLKRNVSLHPESANAHWNLAHSYAESWMMEDALGALEKAESIEPQPGAVSMRASIAGRTGDVDTALALYQDLAKAEGPITKMASSAAMSALYSDKLSAQEVADLHRQLFSPLADGARAAASFKNDRSPKRRIRLGMVSADFHHQHPVNIFMQPVLARLNPEQFETTMYFTGVSHDDQTALARRRVTHWVDASKLNDAQLARRIEDDAIDLLLDLAGHTSLNRLQMFAHRAAPVQLSFLGYPGSTGVPNIDWMLVDPVVAPEGSESLFTERLLRLPHTVFCFAPEIDYPYPKYTGETARRTLTFGSFNNVPKLTAHTINLWSSVLKAVPESRLLLKAPSFKDESAIRAFKARFIAEGIAEDRLEFRGPTGLTDMMAEYADVDIALDPVPYNGGTTSLQAMWMGVPVVVKAGNNFVSRMGASFMTAAGLADWVAEDDAAYVRIATKMAQDRKALLQLKQGLRERLLAAPGWNIDAYAKDFERVLLTAWGDFCLSKAKP